MDSNHPNVCCYIICPLYYVRLQPNNKGILVVLMSVSRLRKQPLLKHPSAKNQIVKEQALGVGFEPTMDFLRQQINSLPPATNSGFLDLNKYYTARQRLSRPFWKLFLFSGDAYKFKVFCIGSIP